MKFPGVHGKDLKLLKQILNKFFKKSNVTYFVFGSRTTNQYRENSDLDLLICAKKDIPGHILLQLKDELEESDLPFRVDLLEANTLPDSILKSIKQQKLVKL